MTAYYNEIDPYAAEWLQNLIVAGHIAPGDIDQRDIRDVRPSDLRGYDQCHFFAGIGGWSLAARLAGWPDDRPMWTGSCPCQPFSAAGKGGGFTDERHLWPAWFHLIGECRPRIVFGEQVASPAGLGWLDLVHADMEAANYAFAALDICSAGIGAPHIRQRIGFVGSRLLADTDRLGSTAQSRHDGEVPSGSEGAGQSEHSAAISRGGVSARELLASANSRLEGRDARALGNERTSVERSGGVVGLGDTNQGQWRPGRPGTDSATGAHAQSAGSNIAGGVADADGGDAGAEGLQRSGEHGQQPQDGGTRRVGDADGERENPERGVPGGTPAERAGSAADLGPGPTNGFWRDADWLLCRDGKWRPVEPGTFPLAHGIPGRVGRLRAYGNAINPHQFKELIGAYLEGERLCP